MIALTSQQMRAVEQAAVNEGLSFLRLMDNAGSAAARFIRSRFDVSGKSVVILCGKGNNGGDGFVVARKLHDEGAAVTVVFACGHPASNDAAEMLTRIQQSGISIISLETDPYLVTSSVQSASILVDAVYGIGFHGALPDYLRSLFRQVNASSAPVISIDIPSGVNADTGEADSDSLRADHTITFTALKTGLIKNDGVAMSGEVHVAPIGINEALLNIYASDETIITMDMVRSNFHPRQQDSHKGSYGKLLTLCGSRGMLGAAVLSVRAALRCGTGLVVSALPRSLYPIIACQLTEPVFCLLQETSDNDFSPASREELRRQADAASALLIGCGLGTSDGAAMLVRDCLENATCPIVLDADGINNVATHINTLKAVRAPLILTPHPGEMSRLTGLSVAAVQADRTQIAQQFAEKYGVTLVLKGHHTVIASPGQPTLMNTTGNPGMATGGSGDVLAGMIAAFAAQGIPPYQAAMCGVHLHGLAGDKAAARLSQHAMLPSDMIEELSGLFINLENRS